MARGATTLLAWTAVCLSATASFAASFNVIGYDQQLFPRALSADESTLVGDGLVLPLGTSELGMTWTPAGGLNYMPNAGPDQYSIPQAVSANGSVIVGLNQDSSNVTTAWRWTASLGYQPVAPTLNVTRSEATAVSADGQTVVGQLTASSTSSPFVWTSSAGAITLPVQSGNAPILSADGSTVAGLAADDSGFTWTAAGGVQTIQALPGSNNVTSTVISSDGSRLFGQATDQNGNWFAFEYSAGTMISLGAPTVPAGDLAGLGVVGATADGSELVGTQIVNDPTTTDPPVITPWLWTSATGFQSLQSVLTADGINLGDYQITGITGISLDGTELFGQGLADGIQPTTWLAVVPEPTGIAILFPAFAVLAFHRYRRLSPSPSPTSA